MGYLRRHDPSSLAAARRAVRCFEPHGADVHEYAQAMRWVDESCEDDVLALLADLCRSTRQYRDDGREAQFDAEQNALSGQER